MIGEIICLHLSSASASMSVPPEFCTSIKEVGVPPSTVMLAENRSVDSNVAFSIRYQKVSLTAPSPEISIASGVSVNIPSGSLKRNELDPVRASAVLTPIKSPVPASHSSAVLPVSVKKEPKPISQPTSVKSTIG